jgi:predicted  nucleic acid-binding Zn-ribbon protein
MKRILPVLALVLFTGLTACDGGAKAKLRDLAHVDSLRTDSLVRIKDEMLNEVMSSTQFVNDLNGEIAKLKTPLRTGLKAAHPSESEALQAKAERDAVTERVRELVARLDSSEARISSLRARASTLSKRDDQLTQQVALYEKTIADLRDVAERQRSEMQAIIDEQGTKIVALNSKVDTVTRDNVRLAGERSALTDTVSQLTTEKNTAYYVVGTRDELVKKGVLVEEGKKSVLGIFGSRPVAPARTLDPAQFVRIDRLRDRTIALPDGEFKIVTRQDLGFATPAAKKDDRIMGSLKVDRPEKFWEPSRFLVLVRR